MTNAAHLDIHWFLPTWGDGRSIVDFFAADGSANNDVQGRRADIDYLRLIAQAAVEAFDEGVLHRLAGRDVMPGDLVIVGKAQDRCRGQLGTIVAHDHFWLTALGHKPVELAGDTGARE